MKSSLLFMAIVLACGCQSTPEPEQTPSSSNDTTVNATATPASDNNNALTDAQKSEGWQLLFDGQTKNGWHVYNSKTDGAAWVVADGTLHLDPKEKKDGKTVGGGDIVTADEYDNFHLSLEWKVDTGGNSGIIFYVKEDPKYENTYHTGPEMQVLDNERHKDAKINKHRAGDLYDLVSGTPETVKKAGEWNKVDIISNKGALEFRLNDTKVMTTTLWDENWKKMLAGSKFKQWPDFGTYKSGRIALQDHGDPVWYRNIKIKKLQ
jgi:3-keto-disaccharide hydrolase